MSVHVASYGIARFGKREEDLLELLSEAAGSALESAPGGRRPEAIVVGNMVAGPLSGLESLAPRLADRLGLAGTPAWRAEAASASGAATFQLGAHLVGSGAFGSVLVVNGEKLTHVANPVVTQALARSLSPHEVAHGCTMPAMASLVTQTYLRRYRLPLEDVALVTVANRARALNNPNAHLRKPVTAEEVNSSRPIASPLRLLHVSPVSDGAAAVLLTREPGRAEVLGMGQATDILDVASREELTTFRSTREAARGAYEAAHLGRKEVQVAELHDAFAPFQLIDLEDVGFCGPGEAVAWTREGRGDVNGVLPINPSGGLLGRGHPVGASGLVQIAEVARQLCGEAGPMQAGHPTVGLAQSVGGLGSHNFVTILGRVGA